MYSKRNQYGIICVYLQVFKTKPAWNMCVLAGVQNEASVDYVCTCRCSKRSQHGIFVYLQVFKTKPAWNKCALAGVQNERGICRGLDVYLCVSQAGQYLCVSQAGQYLCVSQAGQYLCVLQAGQDRILHLTFNYLLTAGVVGAPQMTSQPVSSVFLCSPLPSGTF